MHITHHSFQQQTSTSALQSKTDANAPGKEESVLAQGADLALAAAPLAAGVGQAHHHVPAFPVRGTQSLENLI